MTKHTPLYEAKLDEGAHEVYLGLYVDGEPYADVYISDRDQDDIDFWRSVANLWMAAPVLLAACEAEEAATNHYDGCDVCGRDYRHDYCLEMHMLIADAKELRQAAIAKAKGE